MKCAFCIPHHQINEFHKLLILNKKKSAFIAFNESITHTNLQNIRYQMCIKLNIRSFKLFFFYIQNLKSTRQAKN